MFLKRLETVGFKSFAERTEVEFVPGVTAVVGPNGSGKSNIIDAVRWVLGEQSARSLRGKKMEDIIFQGSDTRNPLNFAEVSLILNNADQALPIDYNEVNITRRVYRSGESEFFINKQPCRLKDIVDLFMDTGLGRESFSIIGQGRIDEILSSKAEERRAIFEEAAGVLKYKQRKNQAKFKLTETEGNLDRVEDIIHEIKQQIEPLKEQAAIAIKYKEKKAALKKAEISMLITEIEQLHSKWKHLLAEIEEKKLEEIEKKTEIQKKEAELTADRHRIEELDHDIAKLQNELVTIAEHMEQYEGKRNVLKERLKHLKENKQKLLKEKEAKKDRIVLTENELEEERKQHAAAEGAIENARAEMAELENELAFGIEEVEEQIENIKSDYIEYLNERAVLQNEKQSIESQITQAKANVKDGSLDYREHIEREEKLSKRFNDIEAAILSLKNRIEEKENELGQEKQSVTTERTKYESMQQTLYEGNEQLAKLSSRKEMLEEMKESFQGYFYGVKEILQAKKADRLTNIYGAVVDLIEVPARYMTAIDTILGAQSQYIVVPDDEAARNIIHWLKRENKGRATFLPLASIARRSIPDRLIAQLKKQEGYVGIASDLAAAKNGFQKVAEHLMGNVIIAKELHHANQIARVTNRRYRVVTLEGDVVFPGGSMSGGAKRKAKQSLFTREKEIAQISENLERSMARRDTFFRKMERQKDAIAEKEKAVAEKEQQLQVLQESLEEEQSLRNEVAIKLHQATDELAMHRLSEQESKENALKLHGELEIVQDKLQNIDAKIKRADESVETLTERRAKIKRNEEKTEKRLHELQIKTAEWEERRKHHQARIDSLKEELLEYKTESEYVDEQLKELFALEDSASTEEELNKKIDLFQEKRRGTELAIEAKRRERATAFKRTEDEERETKQLHKLHEAFAQGIQEKEVQANRLDVTLENHLTFLQSEYTITFEKAKQDYEKVADLKAAAEQVKKIKQSIKQLGTVNLGAIEEHERLSERYSFLLEQKQDLVEAKKTLYDVIEEMDQEMSERFTGMFTEIQSAFTKVFKQLFGGGHAELKLTDPGNILETGIEIVARPPGKKLRTLELLSGGERALTAIALLFAILRARPVPFCILDEVDAALDEANVVRFGNYLQRFSGQTQFIVITHRKGTMEEANALYGVTMQESGVSRLVSVRLEDTEELIEAT